MSVIAVIPARLQSSRLPNKPMLTIGGKPIVQHVYERCQSVCDRVIVTSSDESIRDTVELFGGAFIGSGNDQHKTGSDRCAFVAELFDPNDIIVNVQCDQPFVDPAHITAAVSELKAGVDVGTVVTPIHNPDEMHDKNIVKCVIREDGKAMYFSRAVIPYSPHDYGTRPLHECYRHIGIYAFRRDTLLALAGAYSPEIERLESLEMLRWMYHGYSVGCSIVDHAEHSIDCLSDYNNAIQIAGK